MGYRFSPEELTEIAKLNSVTQSKVMDYFNTWTDSQPCVFENDCSLTSELMSGFEPWVIKTFGSFIFEDSSDEVDTVIREVGCDNEYNLDIVVEYIENKDFNNETYLAILGYVIDFMGFPEGLSKKQKSLLITMFGEE